MKPVMNNIIIYLLTGLFTFNLYCQNNCASSVYLIYANGMNNSKKQSLNVKEKLKSFFENYENTKTNTKFGIAYNYDEILALELLEAYQQKVGENMELYWKWFFDWSKSPVWFKNIVNKYLGLYSKNILSFSDVEEQYEFYKEILEGDAKFLTVAHSQGNLFSN